jgi:hypothetical protein
MSSRPGLNGFNSLRTRPIPEPEPKVKRRCACGAVLDKSNPTDKCRRCWRAEEDRIVIPPMVKELAQQIPDDDRMLKLARLVVDANAHNLENPEELLLNLADRRIL